MRFSRHRGTTLASLAMVAMWLLPFSIQAATFHVSPQGSDIPPYDTYAKAAHNVADAASLALIAGDTVLVHAGSYSSSDTIYIAKGVTFAGVGRDSVSIIWIAIKNNFGRMASLQGGNEVFGLEFRNPPGPYYNPDVTALHAYTAFPITIHDCRFTDVGVYLDGDTQFDVHSCEFDYSQQSPTLFVGGRNCTVFQNQFNDSGRYGTGKGIWAWLADTVVIEQNKFLAVFSEYDDPFAIEIEECDTAVVRNNLIRNCYVSIIWSETDGLIENNTMIHADPDWFASLEVFQGATDHVIIRNNVFVDMDRPIAWGPQGGVDVAG